MRSESLNIIKKLIDGPGTRELKRKFHIPGQYNLTRGEVIVLILKDRLMLHKLMGEDVSDAGNTELDILEESLATLDSL